MEQFLIDANAVIWGPAMVLFITGTGVYLSFRTRFIQVRWARKWLTAPFYRNAGVQRNGIPPFIISLAAIGNTVGVGNIVGVTAAITQGGPGALFWLWVSAFFGMLIKYAEILLAMRFRIRQADGYTGGAMRYIENGLKSRAPAYAFASLGIAACIGTGNMVQINAVSTALESAGAIPPAVVGIAVCVFCAIVLGGGLNRSTTASFWLFLFVSVFYIMGALLAILQCRAMLADTLSLICKTAFAVRPMSFGIASYGMLSALRYGVARGTFATEAGLGTVTMIHVAANEQEPATQALRGIFEVFMITFICTLTGIVLINHLRLQPTVGGNPSFLILEAYAGVFGRFSSWFIAITISIFGLTTILGWFHYGRSCLLYLTSSRRAVRFYFVLYLCCILVGAVGKSEQVWQACDFFNGLMALPNLIAIIALSDVVAKSAKLVRVD